MCKNKALSAFLFGVLTQKHNQFFLQICFFPCRYSLVTIMSDTYSDVLSKLIQQQSSYLWIFSTSAVIMTQKFMPEEMVRSSHIRPIPALTEVFGSFPIAFTQSMKSTGVVV